MLRLYFMVDRATNEIEFFAGSNKPIEKVTLLEAEDFANKILDAIENIKITRGG